VTRKDKLLKGLRDNPRMVRFDDACRIAERLGFERKAGKGSHCTYGREGESLLLNFQNRGGYIMVYQAKQLDNMVKKYGGQT